MKILLETSLGPEQTLMPQNESNRKFGSQILVGAAGFEPTTSCTPCKRATKLRYAPTGQEILPWSGSFVLCRQCSRRVDDIPQLPYVKLLIAINSPSMLPYT
jgi:hypothetical protein